MSHTATVSVEFRIPQNDDCLRKACSRVGAEYLGEGTHRLYDGEYSGVAVKLQGWVYPVVIQHNGKAKMDDFNGSWGDKKHLNRLKQAYAAEVAYKQACNQFGKAKVRPIAQNGTNYVVEVWE